MALEEHSNLWRAQWVELEVGEGVPQLTAQKNRGSLYFHILPPQMLQDQHLFYLKFCNNNVIWPSEILQNTLTLAKPILTPVNIPKYWAWKSAQ